MTDKKSDTPQTPNAPTSSEIDPLGIHVKDAIATISRLEGLGLQRLEIPLPKCIVLGKLCRMAFGLYLTNTIFKASNPQGNHQ